MPPAANSVRRARPLLGTFVEIVTAGMAQPEMTAGIEAAFAVVARVHGLMSFHAPDSDVSRLNRYASFGSVAVDPWTYQVLEMAIGLRRCSAGIFDIAVAPVLQAIGLLPRRPCRRPRSSATVTSDGIELGPDHRVRFRHPDLTIDLGGIAKGFAVDRAIEELRAHGLSCGLVNAGGDLGAFGPEPETIFIRDPRDPRRSLCRTAVHNQALASTAGCFNPFASAEAPEAAIIDPRTRAPASSNRGATVRAPSCMIADALTKVVMIAGEGSIALLELYQASAMLVSVDGAVRVTTGWQQAAALAA
jgi:thiamine biosynthesis lipoprotein